MELAQEREPVNHNTTHLSSASKQDQEQERDDHIPSISTKNRNQSISSSSSSSSPSSSSIEDGFKPEKSDQYHLSDSETPSPHSDARPVTEQWPQTQVMERSEENATNPNPNNNLTYKLPSHIFARTTSSAPVDWSTLSNESLFSIHMGNTSFAGDYFKSGELTFPQPPLSPIRFNNNHGVSDDVATTAMPLDASKNVAASENRASDVSSKPEKKAAPSITQAVQANEAVNKDVRKMDCSMSCRSDDFSVRSFAFPILGNVDKSGPLQTGHFRKPETPKISSEAQADIEESKQKQEEAQKSRASKTEPEKSANVNNRWLSCFPCCTMSCL
ncbi:PREDICTED: uncharacterized protein LOC104808038 [Tarenaya hassleriana]|uniref:uncharacterized protein LOC104808038 n=1 Tax=Tarenaya hassleriana TaxID=28532 RepID=UPI00053C40C1|nr:PREDICTED: uncharacterized protein LOC104808038 [Tarenaya hassleriana]XP_010531844.1 PREDICTED: uncharacterized protein LOC104808038 [Tarenaya hassleriana]XP_010531845.1 PREDICTED: uncharacterized protein LOC104808038 [Tarenaya hassleriana]